MSLSCGLLSIALDQASAVCHDLPGWGPEMSPRDIVILVTELLDTWERESSNNHTHKPTLTHLD